METNSRYYFTPVKKRGEHGAVERIKAPLSKGVYAWPDYTGRGRSIKPSELKPNDWICFYACGKVGVVAHAKVSKGAEKNLTETLTRCPIIVQRSSRGCLE